MSFEHVMSYESLPRNIEKTEMVKENNFNQGVMIYTIHLLRIWLLLYKVSHLVNVSK